MRRTLTTGLLFGILAISGVARAQSTGEEHRAAGMAACWAAELFARAYQIDLGFTPGWDARGRP